MKKKFSGYYKLSEDDFKKLWTDSLFVFDTSVLLNLFRYSEETSLILFQTIEKLKDHLWIPYKVAEEYHSNINEVIVEQTNRYEETTNILENFLSKIEEKRSHPFLKKETQEKIKQFCIEITSELTQKKKTVKDLLHDNPTKENLANVIGDNIGDRFSEDELKKIYNEGEVRFSNKIPPGFKDNNKKGDARFGDLVVWKEVLKKAKTIETPLIFVTDDVKKDWFQEFFGEKIGPHPLLMQEFKSNKDLSFYIYTTDKFLEYAGKLLKVPVSAEVLEEIKKNTKKNVSEGSQGDVHSSDSTSAISTLISSPTQGEV